MIEKTNPEFAQEIAACMVEVACNEVSQYLHESSGNVETEIVDYFSGTNHFFFMNDLRRFSNDLSNEYSDIDFYPTYIGLIVGAFVAERSGFINLVRHEFEAITDDSDIRQRSLLYEQLYMSDAADPIEPFIPRPLDSAYLTDEYRNGTRAVIGETVVAIYDPELDDRLKLAKIGMAYDMEFFTSSEEIDLSKMVND